MLSRPVRNSLLLLLLLCVASVKAQKAGPEANKPSPDASQNSQPVLRTTTRLVQLNVVVRKKNGDPVTNLKPQDFTVFDDGRMQKIATFSNETTAQPSQTATPVAPNVFSNRLDRGGKPAGSVTIILFDALNTPLTDQAYARQEVIRFLRRLQPGDHVAIYALSTQIKILHEFTQDIASLLRALDRYQGKSSHLLDAATESPEDQAAEAQAAGAQALGDQASVRALEDFLNSTYGALADFANIRRVEITTKAFEAIANHVAGIPGRKNLVWVSASFPLTIGFGETFPPPNREIRAFTPELERAARAVNQANMAIYPVDARGLMPSPAFSAAQRFTANPRSPAPVAPRLFPDHANFDTMNVIAERTGGRAFYNTNDLASATRAAISDAEFSYLIGFYPDHGKWGGKFHELKVRVNVKHAEIRHRKGYFATSGSADNPKDTKAALDSAVWSPVESTALGMQVTVKPVSGRILALSTKFDAHQVEFTQMDGRWVGGLEVLFLQLGAGNKTTTGEQKTVRMDLKRETFDEIVKDGLILTRDLAIAPETRSVRIVVRDLSSGAVGSVSVPVERFLVAASPGAGQQNAPRKN